MKHPWPKRIGLLLVILAVGASFYAAFREPPVPVDVARAIAGPMEVTIDEEGVTRVRDVFTVSSPIAGHLDRVTLDEGDAVQAGKTVIASIQPLEPPFLDERTLRELGAAVEAARSAVAVAELEHERARTAEALALSEYRRAARLAETDIVSESTLERAVNDLRIKEAQVKSAAASIRLRQAELASAEARLVQPGAGGKQEADQDCCVTITAPVDGVVLSVIARSEQAVSVGTRIAEIGDPRRLEVAVDLLSADAVRVHQGSPAIITDWGGEDDLAAVVRRVEPAGFTKVSALGIEEQRVNAILDIEETPEGLGHGFRVVARLVVWRSQAALQVPISALFRAGGAWSVFVAANGRAERRSVRTGHLNASHAQILAGLEAGDTVILYPSDRLDDGSAITIRETDRD